MPFLSPTSRNHSLDLIFSLTTKTPEQGRGVSPFMSALRRQYPKFSVHPIGKTVLDRKMISNFSNGLDVLYHHAKFRGDCTTCTGCRYENMLFVCFCVFVTFRSSYEGCMVRTCIVSHLIEFDAVFDLFSA